MSKRRLALALLAPAVLLAGLWFAFGRLGDGPARDGAAAAPSNAGPLASAPDAGADLATGSEPSSAGAPDAGADATRPARAVATTEYEDELARGHWIEGRVKFPKDTPLDERVKVVARGKAFEHGPAHAAPVSSDGSFRVACANGTSSAWLDLEARYLYLDPPVRVSAAEPGTVALAARLGGVIRGRVVPPPDAPGAVQALVGRHVTLRGWKLTGPTQTTLPLVRSVELDASLTFAFTGLPVDMPYAVVCDPAVYPAVEVEDVHVQAGAETVLDLPALLGVSIAGRVVDEGGAAVSAVMVVADTSPGHGGRSSTTGEDGRFALEGLASGFVTLTVTAKGYQPFELELGNCERGAQVKDVELKLARGSSIAGRVLWPDGSPAQGATVTAEGDGSRFVFGPSASSKTDAGGAFTLTGLEPGPQRLQARATRKETVLVASELTGKEREKTVRTTLRASLADVEAGALEVLLQLSDGLSLSGIVVDDLGVSLEAFRVLYAPVVDSDPYSHLLNEQGHAFKDAHGAFVLDGLEPGAYRIRVEASGHSTSPQVEVAVPVAVPLAPLRLARSARLAGEVLTPAGEPAPKALIETTGRPQQGIFALAPFEYTSERYWPAGEADGAGRFDIADVAAGTLKVRATFAGHGPSEPVELTLAPGASMAGLVLQLAPGATLTGTVVDAQGQGLARRLVQVDLSQGSFEASLQTDEAGRFELRGLEPGTYTVVAPPSEDELAALGVSAGSGANELLARTVELELGLNGADIVLAPVSLRPVRVFGTLTAGGEPVSTSLRISPASGGDPIAAESDAEGAYEVLLPAPGAYNFMLSLDDGASSLRVPSTVEGPAEQRLDFDVPVGSIAGRVHGPDGPLAGVRVELRLERAEGTQDYGRGHTDTDGDGRYRIERLPVGTWTVQAGGDTGRLPVTSQPGEASYTYAEAKGIAVASGQRVRDVDLHVGAGGRLAGRVLTATGEPAPWSSITVRSPAGELVSTGSFSFAGSDGSFSVGGMAPGDYLLGTVSGTDQVAEASVTVEAGKELRVDLRLAAGTLVRVLVKDKEGAPVLDAHVTCQADGGRDRSSSVDRSRTAEPLPGERRLGPLPPGTYTFQADRQGAASVAQSVTLKGEPELVVELVL